MFQFGTQQRSDSKFRHACELVRNGRIGDLHTINVWAPASSSGGPLERTTPPETLDYDRWLGPAPAVPYTKDRETNEWWWFISDYALGFIAGWGIHPLDIALWGGGDLLEGPIDVEGTGTFPEDGLCDTATHWDVTCSYSSGVKIRFRSAPAPEEWQERYGEILSHGTAFEGTEGWVLVDRQRVQTSPSNLAESEIGPDEIRLYKSDHHMRNFIECARDGKQAICPIDTAVQSDILCHISDIAIRLGRKLRWDPAKERFVRDDAANRRLTRSMRSPWHL